MAVYSNINYLTHNDHQAFNVDHSPGQPVPFSGIYRCLGCHREIVGEKARQFPPQIIINTHICKGVLDGD
jgi:hypothetical protein